MLKARPLLQALGVAVPGDREVEYNAALWMD
jgi:hypothetical protein